MPILSAVSFDTVLAARAKVLRTRVATLPSPISQLGNGKSMAGTAVAASRLLRNTKIQRRIEEF